MDDSRSEIDEEALRSSWRSVVARYQKPELARSLWQIANSVIPYLVLWGVMVWSLRVSYWLTLAISVLAAGFLVRVFIIFHDCGHNSFFESKRANTVVGIITGLLTFTAYHYWTRDHAIHHATAGDLDQRGVGDVETLTVREYLALSPFRRFIYRMMRNPLLMFGIGSSLVFLVVHRIPRPRAGKKGRASVLWTNLALLGILLILGSTIGLKAVLLVQLPITFLGTAVGVWMFYVQHQFEGVYWARHDQWDYLTSAMRGASYYQLPRLLQWFSGNIGFHHLHHLSPKIPNYHLERCQRENPIFAGVRPLTLLSSLRSLRLRLYDEERGRLIGFRELNQLREASNPV
jgi:omega-6 fatty acid desaturase (delta-12 desaturase)